MMSRLGLLKRKQKGKQRCKSYKRLFTVFDSPIWMDLEKTDEIIAKMRRKFAETEFEIEFLENRDDFVESRLIREIFLPLVDSETSYVFADDYHFCGVYLVDSKEAFSKALWIAKEGKSNTCFVLDCFFRFSFRINYYDEYHTDFPKKYDIQRHKIP